MATERVEIPLYGGKVIVEFLPKSHRYTLKGDKTPLVSVSAACGIVDKPFLLGWAINLMRDYLLASPIINKEVIIEASKQHTKVKDEAADIGTQFHQWCDDYAAGKNPEIPADEKVRNAILAFMRWVNAENIKFTANEKVVYSKSEGYVGKFDAMGNGKEGGFLVDFKTSKRFYPLEHGMQTAAYLRAYVEELLDGHTPEEIDYACRDYGRKIARFDKETGEFHVHDLKDFDADWKAYKAALTLKKRQKECDKLDS